jgi:hypothetical protein
MTIHGVGEGDYWFLSVGGRPVRISMKPSDTSVDVLPHAIRLLGVKDSIPEILKHAESRHAHRRK